MPRTSHTTGTKVRGQTALAVGVCLTLWMILSPATMAAEPTYWIKLARPEKVGTRYIVSKKGSSEQSTRVSSQGKLLRETRRKMTVELDATVEILKVNQDGRSLKKKLTVIRCELTEMGQSKPLLAKGKVIVAETANGRTRLSLDGGVMPEATRKALDIIITTYSGGPADDEIFGSDKPRRVGERWQLNAEAAVRDAATRDVTIQKADIEGTVTLTGVEKHASRRCLRLSARMKIRDFGLKKLQLPPGVLIEQADARATYGGLLPLDPKAPRLQSSHTMKFDMVMKGTRGNTKGLTVTMHVEMSAEETVRMSP